MNRVTPAIRFSSVVMVNHPSKEGKHKRDHNKTENDGPKRIASEEFSIPNGCHYPGENIGEQRCKGRKRNRHLPPPPREKPAIDTPPNRLSNARPTTRTIKVTRITDIAEGNKAVNT